MEKSLLEKALSRSANYTESAHAGQILLANLLIRYMNSRFRSFSTGSTGGFAQ